MLKRHIMAFLKLLAIQHKGKSHFTFRIAVIRIDKLFADRRFLYFLFCLFGQCVKKALAFLYLIGINAELRPRFSKNECGLFLGRSSLSLHKKERRAFNN